MWLHHNFFYGLDKSKFNVTLFPMDKIRVAIFPFFNPQFSLSMSNVDLVNIMTMLNSTVFSRSEAEIVQLFASWEQLCNGILTSVRTLNSIIVPVNNSNNYIAHKTYMVLNERLSISKLPVFPAQKNMIQLKTCLITKSQYKQISKFGPNNYLGPFQPGLFYDLMI